MHLRHIAAVLTLIAIPGSAAAQNAAAMMANPSFQDPAPERCVTSFEMQHCAAHDLRVADAAMGRGYFAARARLGPSGRTKLLADQRRWLAYRDRNCMTQSMAYRGGTASPVAFGTCLVETTRARTIICAGFAADLIPPSVR